MIVSDASAIVELLLAGERATRIRVLLEPHPELHVPEHFHIEVLSALRRYAVRGELSDRRADRAIAALGELRALTYPTIALTEQIWEMRDRLTAYDAAYLALARRLDVELVTLDRGLEQAARREGRLAGI